MSQMMPKKVVLMISTDSGLPHKTQMLADDGSLIMQRTYSNFRINIPIDDSEFDFTPPPEAQVMDMSKIEMSKKHKIQARKPKGR